MNAEVRRTNTEGTSRESRESAFGEEALGERFRRGSAFDRERFRRDSAFDERALLTGERFRQESAKRALLTGNAFGRSSTSVLLYQIAKKRDFSR